MAPPTHPPSDTTTLCGSPKSTKTAVHAKTQLDAAYFPHLIDDILNYVHDASPIAFHSLQAVCTSWRERIKARLFSRVMLVVHHRSESCHIWIVAPPMNFKTIKLKDDSTDEEDYNLPTAATYFPTVLPSPPIDILLPTATAYFAAALPWATQIDIRGSFADDTLNTIATLATRVKMVRMVEQVGAGRTRFCPFPPSVTVVAAPDGLTVPSFSLRSKNPNTTQPRRSTGVLLWDPRSPRPIIDVLEFYRPTPRLLVIMFARPPLSAPWWVPEAPVSWEKVSDTVWDAISFFKNLSVVAVANICPFYAAASPEVRKIWFIHKFLTPRLAAAFTDDVTFLTHHEYRKRVGDQTYCLHAML